MSFISTPLDLIILVVIVTSICGIVQLHKHMSLFYSTFNFLYFMIRKLMWLIRKLFVPMLPIASIWHKICLDICPQMVSSKKHTVSREHSSRKTVSFEEQIMSKDKYSKILLGQVEEAITGTIIILQTIFAPGTGFENWGISLSYSPVLAGGYSVMWHLKTDNIAWAKYMWWVCTK